jgi:hypothetical protein
MKPDQNPSSELDLRWRLRQLPKERDVPASVWASLEKKLGTASQNTMDTTAKQRSKFWPGVAFAACLAVFAMVGLSMRQQGPAPAQNNLQAQLVSRQVDFMALEYQAAIQELGHADQQGRLSDSAAQAQLKLLDDSAQQIRQALLENPSATYLLDRLRRTYMQRLQITQRIIIS